MKISKQDSNYEIEVSAEEITSIAGLLKNDNAMDVISTILRYFQIQTDRKIFEEDVKKQELTKTKIEVTPDNKANKSEDDDLEYFVGIPNTSDEAFIKKMKD